MHDRRLASNSTIHQDLKHIISSMIKENPETVTRKPKFFIWQKFEIYITSTHLPNPPADTNNITWIFDRMVKHYRNDFLPITFSTLFCNSISDQYHSGVLTLCKIRRSYLTLMDTPVLHWRWVQILHQQRASLSSPIWQPTLHMSWGL